MKNYNLKNWTELLRRPFFIRGSGGLLHIETLDSCRLLENRLDSG